MRLASSEELPVHMTGPKFQPKAEISIPLGLAINNPSPHVEAAARERGDADLFVLLPNTLAFYPRTVGADIHGGRSFQNTSEIRSQKVQRNLHPEAAFDSSVHAHKSGPVIQFSCATFSRRLAGWKGLANLPGACVSVRT